jgi:ABC-type Fe3+/spermidine/putrescine transport system ATPase subunit
MNKENQSIEETLTLMTELAKNQEKALKMANDIISMKNRLIELCEQETALYKKEARRRGITILVLSAWMIITSVIQLCRLL